MGINELVSYPDMAVDVGTANIEWYIHGQGLVAFEEEPIPEEVNQEEAYQVRSVVVSRKNSSKKVEAIGQKAYNQIGRVAEGLEVLRPVKIGRIYDEDAFRNILITLITRIYPKYFSARALPFTRPTIVVGVPCNATEVEKRAIRDIISYDLKAKPVLVSEPVAAALGSDLDFRGSSSCAIIDIGGGTTDLAVLASGYVLPYSTSIEIGGDVLDHEIVQYVKHKHDLMLGERTAEWVKVKIGTAMPFEDNRLLTADVKGRPLKLSVKKDLQLTSDEIRDALSEQFKKLADGLRVHIEAIEEPQIHEDLNKHGLFLTGGGSLIDNMDKYLSKELGFKVQRVEKPLLSVILGAGKMLNEPDLLKKFALP